MSARTPDTASKEWPRNMAGLRQAGAPELFCLVLYKQFDLRHSTALAASARVTMKLMPGGE